LRDKDVKSFYLSSILKKEIGEVKFPFSFGTYFVGFFKNEVMINRDSWGH